jgi:hypothetical protein
MAFSRRWTAWNLTATGWHRSQNFADPTHAMQYRLDGTLLAVVSSRLVDDLNSNPMLSVVYRSADADAVLAAVAAHGEKPPA